MVSAGEFDAPGISALVEAQLAGQVRVLWRSGALEVGDSKRRPTSGHQNPPLEEARQ